ncbi:hypothetical protein LPW11_02150 [Geomonas sp. RF6]|uniref:hypothetical protein n=1 Tax=Geomonas sp. RF6 TaxID=2897342 RepID=UPI001E5A12DA|nr:hypothetical protein [Geomonas sp. RF6]UFS70999.1 hypothetical protein LPW11_02150 [Geomonas sp. RF6]
MKKVVLIAVTVVLVATAGFFLFTKDPKALQVSEVGNPAGRTGIIAITGIVAGASDFDKNVFGIMDTKEASCKKGCEKIFIPIKYLGEQPDRGDEVKAKGKFTKIANYYVFEAENVKVLRNHAFNVQKGS